MGPINTGNDYKILKAAEKKKLVKKALVKANLEQKALAERADKLASSNG